VQDFDCLEYAAAWDTQSISCQYAAAHVYYKAGDVSSLQLLELSVNQCRLTNLDCARFEAMGGKIVLQPITRECNRIVAMLIYEAMHRLSPLGDTSSAIVKQPKREHGL
jgi:hypothetical protein